MAAWIATMDCGSAKMPGLIGRGAVRKACETALDRRIRSSEVYLFDFILKKVLTKSLARDSCNDAPNSGR
jgi:hypothetical protein